MLPRTFRDGLLKIRLYHKRIVPKSGDIDLFYKEIQHIGEERFEKIVGEIIGTFEPPAYSLLVWIKKLDSKIYEQEQNTIKANFQKDVSENDPVAFRYLQIVHKSIRYLNDRTDPTYKEFWEAFSAPVEKAINENRPPEYWKKILDGIEDALKSIKQKRKDGSNGENQRLQDGRREGVPGQKIGGQT